MRRRRQRQWRRLPRAARNERRIGREAAPCMPASSAGGGAFPRAGSCTGGAGRACPGGGKRRSGFDGAACALRGARCARPRGAGGRPRRSCAARGLGDGRGMRAANRCAARCAGACADAVACKRRGHPGASASGALRGHCGHGRRMRRAGGAGGAPRGRSAGNRASLCRPWCRARWRRRHADASAAAVRIRGCGGHFAGSAAPACLARGASRGVRGAWVGVARGPGKRAS